MDGNPYARMLGVIRGESADQSAVGDTAQTGLGTAPCRMRIGTVTQRVPLKISVAGLEQPTENLRINERLIKNAQWKVQITSPESDYKQLTGILNAQVTCPGDGCAPKLEAVTDGALHSTDTQIGRDTETGKATVKQLEIDLDVGDQVLALTENDQIFYILMKVVKAV